MTRTRLTVDANSVFHLPGKHNQKSHGNRKGRKENVPIQSSVRKNDDKDSDVAQRDAGSASTERSSVQSDADRAIRDAEVERRFSVAVQGEDAFDALEFATKRDLINYVNTEHDGEIDGVSAAEMNVAINRYVGDEYTEVNGALRSGNENDLISNDETIRGLDAALSVSGTTDDIVVHRGILNATTLFGDAWRSDGDNTGLEWRDDAFVSTTTDPDVAEFFARSGQAPNPNQVQMRVLVPRGTPALAPRSSRDVGISGDELPEDEIILGRELRYRVARDYRERDSRGNEIRKIDVEIVK